MTMASRRGILRAALIGCAASGLWAIPAPSAHAAQATVYVFAITDVRPRALQKMMEDEMPGTQVTVFGRVGDFSRALKASPPNAAVALAPVLSAFGQTPALQGVDAGSSVEEYLLLSREALQESDLHRSTIGCIDLVGRKKLPEFVADVLKLDPPPTVRRVTKVEDLLQLLQFQRADAILLPQRFLTDLQQRSRMTLEILRLPQAKVKRTAIAFPGNRSAVESALRRLSADTLKLLGVDGWQ
jgi:hypothetical protein